MDYKLKIFKTAAQAKSFSQASKILNLSQPAVSKSIKNLEESYGRALFERKANAIELTEYGMIFLDYAERILQLYEELEDELSDGKSLLLNEIKIGASTTIANYILPKLLASVQSDYQELNIDLIIGNTLEIQQMVLRREINLGFVEGDNHNTRLHYEKFIKDKLVLVSKNNQEDTGEIMLSGLNELPIIGREIGSGTREVIENSLSKKNIRIRRYKAVFGSTESIKNYLIRNAGGYSFLSMHSIEQELAAQKLKITNVEGIEINRWFYSITRQGFQSGQTTRIKNLLIQAYNQRQ